MYPHPRIGKVGIRVTKTFYFSGHSDSGAWQCLCNQYMVTISCKEQVLQLGNVKLDIDVRVRVIVRVMFRIPGLVL